MAAAAAIPVVGGVIKGVGALMQGQQESDALDYQSQIQRQNASQALVAAKINADRQQIVASKQLGSIQAGYAASGVDLDSGSALAILGASAANAEFDRQNILHGGDVRAINYENQASIDDVASKHALQAGYFNAIGSMFGVAGTIASKYSGGGAVAASSEGGSMVSPVAM